MAYQIPSQTFDGVVISPMTFDDLSSCRPVFKIEPYWDISFEIIPAGGDYKVSYGLFNLNAVTMFVASNAPVDCNVTAKTLDPITGKPKVVATGEFNILNTYTYDNKTVYYNGLVGIRMNGALYSFTYTSTPKNDYNPDLRRTCWLMVYGGYDSSYTVTYDLTGCTGADTNPDKLSPSSAITRFSFTLEEEYYFTDSSVKIDGEGADGKPVAFNFDKTTGELSIGTVGSDLTIHVTATKDPYEQGGNTGDDDTKPEGGGGTYDDSTENIPVPDPPMLSVVNTGMISMFSPTLSQVQALGNFMWSDAFDLDTFKKLFGDAMSAILGLSIIPVAPVTGASTNVTLGNISTSISMPIITSQYVTQSLGSITVDEYWGGYLDYSPYTQVEIFLPFIGMRPLSTDDVMGKTLSVNYTVDVLSGACIAFLSVDGSVLYQFAGQCALSIPVTGNDWTNVLHSAVSIAASIGTVVATGGLTAPASVAMGATMAGNVVSAKTRVERSGSLSGGAGMMGVKKPYLIITRPRQALPNGLPSFEGYPSLVTRTLGSVSGFTTVSAVHLEGLTCTDAEKEEIRNLLQTGVIL